ncbi:hypothetical protein D3Z52_00240 [Clostridiaceae bacterium]|nr:hypothetical protein [Clostridiaceae bacterium]
MRQHLGVWGESPSGCRAEPCRSPRRRRVQGRALPLAAQARGAGAEPCRSPRRRGVQGQRPAARRAGAGCRGSAPAGSPEGGALGGGGGKLLGKIRFSRFLIKLSLYSVETLGFDGFLTLFCCEF